jgi:hypothetical protein
MLLLAQTQEVEAGHIQQISAATMAQQVGATRSH